MTQSDSASLRQKHDHNCSERSRRRVANLRLSAWRGDLLLDDSREAVTLRINQGNIELLPAAPSPNSVSGNEAIAQLMFGTDDPEETIDTGRIR